MVTNPEQGRPRYFTVCHRVQPYSVGVATIVAVYDCLFVLKRGTKLARLSLTAV